jgi:acyl-CoA thioesterase I
MNAVKFCLTSLLVFSPLCQADGLLVLGDSLSAAYRIDRDQGWVNLLSQQLPQPQIHNASISGETTGGGLSRLPRLLEELEPNWVLIELGGNDGLRGYPVQTIRANLKAMIEAVEATGAQPIIMEIVIPPNYGDRYSQAFRGIYAELAAENDIPMLTFMLEEIALTPDLMQEDGIHPTAEAQPQIAQKVASELALLLPVSPAEN